MSFHRGLHGGFHGDGHGFGHGYCPYGLVGGMGYTNPALVTGDSVFTKVGTVGSIVMVDTVTIHKEQQLTRIQSTID